MVSGPLKEPGRVSCKQTSGGAAQPNLDFQNGILASSVNLILVILKGLKVRGKLRIPPPSPLGSFFTVPLSFLFMFMGHFYLGSGAATLVYFVFSLKHDFFFLKKQIQYMG